MQAEAEAKVSEERALCAANAGAQMAAYKAKLAAGQFWEATLEIRRCAEVTSDEALVKLVREAELKAYVYDVTTAKVPLDTRVRSMEALKSEYPDIAAKYSKVEQQLVLATAAQAKQRQAQLMETRRRIPPPLGITQRQVVDDWWGLPQGINRTISAAGEREQWVYGDRRYLYFENGRLTTVQD